MSDIKITAQLYQDIQQAVQRQDPQAGQAGVMQYLAAVMGYMIGSQRNLSQANRDAYIEELCGFARHVCNDVVQRQQPSTPAPAGQAFGYWTPPK